jgi:hypothetical protein
MERDNSPEEGFKIQLNPEGHMMIPEIPLIIPSSDEALDVIRNAQIQRRRKKL